MKICYFGIYNKNYPRNQIIIKGLRQNGVEVLECNSRKRGLVKYLDLWLQHQKVKNKYDLMIVGFLGQGIIKFAKKLTTKPIILDAFVSQYLTNILDRELYPKNSSQAKKNWSLDRKAYQLANLILLDTQTQIDYFIKTFDLLVEKFTRIFVGADDKIYFPQKNILKPNKFIVHWHGYIAPFHGLKTIIQAANILKNYQDIEFRIITRFNNQYKKIKEMVENLGLNNIKFYSETSYQNLAKLINQSDVCLGIFGNNQKAKVVIPNKIYEAIACAKPVITCETLAAKELLTNGQNVLFCQPDDPQDLINRILELKNNSELRKKITDNGHKLYLEKLTPKIVTKELITVLKSLI